MNRNKLLKLMHIAFKEAQKAGNKTLTNPLVGAIVEKNGKIIAKGYHKEFGGEHAEEQALKKAGNNAEGANLIVTLEPCSTYGKRPPCTELIKKYRIKNVYFATYDINPKNANKAKKILAKNNIASFCLNMNDKQYEINKHYIKNITKKEPYITIKAAISLDGKMCDAKGKSKWITTNESRKQSHKLRSQHNAILIGSNTLVKDNPKLTIRNIKTNSQNPDVIILSTKGNFNITKLNISKLKNRKIIIATTQNGKKQIIKKAKKIPSNIFFETFKLKKGKINLKQLLKILLEKYNISSILVEGGGKTITSFIEEKLCDRIVLYIAPKFFGNKENTCPFITSKINFVNSSPLFKVKTIKKLKTDIMIELEKI